MGLIDFICAFDWISPAWSLIRDARGTHFVGKFDDAGLSALRRQGIPYSNPTWTRGAWLVDIPAEYEEQARGLFGP